MDNLNFFDRKIVENNEVLQSLRVYSIGLGILLVILIAVLIILIIRKKSNQDLVSRTKKNTKFAEFYIRQLAENPPEKKQQTEVTPLLTHTSPTPVPQPEPVSEPETAPQQEPTFRTSPIQQIDTGDPQVLEIYFQYDDNYKI